MKRCKISSIPEQVVLGAHKNLRIDHRKRGIEDVKNLSFVVSMILQFLENSAFRESLLVLSNSLAVMKSGKSDEHKTFLFIILSYINQLLRSNNRVDPRDIILLVEVFFPSFSNLDLTHINSVTSLLYSLSLNLQTSSDKKHRYFTYPMLFKTIISSAWLQRELAPNVAAFRNKSKMTSMFFPLRSLIQ